MTNDTEEPDKDELEELFEESTGEGRTDVDSAPEDDESETDLVGAIATAYAELDEGDRDTAISTRDKRLAAILGGLAETGQIESTAESVWDDLEADPESAMHTKSALVSGLLQVGLEEALPDVADYDDEAWNHFLREFKTR
jgi:hypothetical protein